MVIFGQNLRKKQKISITGSHKKSMAQKHAKPLRVAQKTHNPKKKNKNHKKINKSIAK